VHFLSSACKTEGRLEYISHKYELQNTVTSLSVSYVHCKPNIKHEDTEFSLCTVAMAVKSVCEYCSRVHGSNSGPSSQSLF
jgi:hypothetical protein